MKSAYEYVLTAGEDLGDHLGEWIAVVGEEIVSYGEDAKEVYRASREKHPNETPLIMKIPKETVMLL